MMLLHRRVVSVFLLAFVVGPASLAAQGYKGEVRIRADVIGLRGLQRDSVAESSVPGEGLQRRLDDGTVALCVAGDFCRWYRSGDEASTVSPVYEDLRLTVWPGPQGLSMHTQLRTRFFSDDAWPRTDQKFDAITAYLRYQRSGWEVAAGRLLRSSGLGFRNFDGASVLWSGLEVLRLEIYGGWSLAPGANAPRNGNLMTAADVFAPDRRGLIFGAEAGFDVRRRFFLSGQYQREIRTDELALYSERIAVDARLLLGGLTVDGSLAYDLAYGQVNSGRLRAGVPLGSGLHVTVEGRHYTPFFELWTIWGAFSPIGFNEGNGFVRWSLPGTSVELEVGGGYRDYEETAAGSDFAPVRNDGWRLFGGGRWTGHPWFIDGGYRSETGFGAARYGGDLTFGRRLGSEARVALHGTITRAFGEFRIGEQTTSGAGLDLAWTVGDLTVSGSAGLYRIAFDKRPQNANWTQGRAHLAFAYRFGSTATPRVSMRGIGGY